MLSIVSSKSGGTTEPNVMKDIHPGRPGWKSGEPREEHTMTRRLPPEQVIALHCSGAGAGQWRQLGELLGSRYQLIAPEHYGTDSVGPWTGERAFELADEAVRTLAIIDGTDRSVHLVGHSYGGGVAPLVALAHPAPLANPALVEPSPSPLLAQIECGA